MVFGSTKYKNISIVSVWPDIAYFRAPSTWCRRCRVFSLGAGWAEIICQDDARLSSYQDTSQ